MSKRIPIEPIAAQLRELGAHRMDQRELESLLKRPLTPFERKAIAYARDSKRHQEGLKRPHTRRQENIIQTGIMRLKARPIESDVDFAFDRRDAHESALPARGHTLRARYTDVPNPAGNANEKRLARIVAAKARSSGVDSHDSTPPHTFTTTATERLSKTSRGYRVVRGRVRED